MTVARSSLAARAIDAFAAIERTEHDRIVTRARARLATILDVPGSEIHEAGTFAHREGGPHGSRRGLDLLMVGDLEFVVTRELGQAEEIHLLAPFEDEETGNSYRAVEATAITMLSDVGEALASPARWYIPRAAAPSPEERTARALERIAELLDGWRNGS